MTSPNNRRAEFLGPSDLEVPEPTAPVSCAAPWTSLKLDPTGQVDICRYSVGYPLGRIRPGGPGLREIWEGPRVAAVRAALSDNDHSLGCGACAPARWVDHPDLSPSRTYDELRGSAGHSWPQIMDFALSNTCNLRCLMCHGDLSSAIRSRREKRPPLISPYDDDFFADLSAFLPHLKRCNFNGGEPFLGRATRRVWSMISQLDDPPEVLTVTNGTVWDDRVEHEVRSLRMSIVVSIDGATAATCEQIRVGLDHAELLVNLQRFRALTAEIGTSTSLNYCLMKENAHELADFLCWAADLGLPVRVIDVTSPSRFDPTTLPADERIDLGRRLAADEVRVGQSLGINRTAWRRAAGRLRRPGDAASATHLSPPVALELRRPEAPPWAAGDLVAEISDRTGERPLVIHTDGPITEVESQQWAASLRTETWVGRDHVELLSLLVGHYGVEPLIESVDRHDGLPAFRLTFSSQPDPVVLQVVASNDGTAGGPRDFLVSFESGV